jgi:Zn-dependent peptidase ImmA (M78 family)
MHGRIMQLKLDEITNIIKSYNLDTMFFITYAFQVKGQYIPEDDVIILNPQFTKKEFVITLLHEICHALDCKRLGLKKYLKKYNQAGQMAVHNGLDFYNDNKWEQRAEKFAHNEYKRRNDVSKISRV